MSGGALIARLHAAADEVVALLSRVSSVHRPPLTSQDRRRAADDAERAGAALVEVCDDLDGWVASRQERPEPREHPPGLGAVEADDDRSDALGMVWRAQETLDRDRSELDRAVEAARAHGASWRQIGEALGIAAQSAHKRFDPRARQRHADYMRDRYRRLRGHDDPPPVGAERPSMGERSPTVG